MEQRDNRLDAARERIDAVDREMARLFRERMDAVKEVAAVKRKTGQPIYDPGREASVVAHRTEELQDEVLAPYYGEFLRQTMALSREYQKRLMRGVRVAFSGVEGAYAAMAAEVLFPEGEMTAMGSFEEAYNAVVHAAADFAILPLENSDAGEVTSVIDLLFEGPLYIERTLDLSVAHVVAGLPGATLDDIRTVTSHPQALRQCSAFIQKAGWKQEVADNTARAAETVLKAGDKSLAAICSRHAAERLGLSVVRADVTNRANNTTRFAVLGAAEPPTPPAEAGSQSVLFFTVKNEAGALGRALNIIGSHGFNLRVLRSRPRKDLLWSYYFYAETEGNLNTAIGRDMLEALRATCDIVKVVGTFAVSEGVAR